LAGLILPVPNHQPLPDRLQFEVQLVELAGEHADHLAHQRRHAFSARQMLQQLGHLLGSLGHGNADLHLMAADRVDQHRALR